jgi:hypothetical protein
MDVLTRTGIDPSRNEWQWIRPTANLPPTNSIHKYPVFCFAWESACRGANPLILLVFDTTIFTKNYPVPLPLGRIDHILALGGESTTRLGGANRPHGCLWVELSKPVWGEYAVGRIHQIPCEIPRDDLFSDDFGFKINTLVSNLAHIFIIRRPLIILLKNIVYLEGILHFSRCKLGGWTIRQLVFRKSSIQQIQLVTLLHL